MTTTDTALSNASTTAPGVTDVAPSGVAAGAGHAGDATRRTHVAALDGVRAIAALLVLLHHAGFASGATFDTAFGPYLARMDVGVAIFFVLSGFLLYRPMVARQFAHRPQSDPRPFWIRRATRIFPAYWLALVVLLAAGAIAVRGAAGFFWSATLTHIYHPERGISGITQSWSLATEISFYLVLPLVAALGVRWLRKRSVADQALALLAGLAAVCVASVLFRIAVHEWAPRFRGVAPFWLPSLADIFALGMALAVLSAWAEHHPTIRGLCQRVGARAAWFVAGSVVAFWFVSTQLELARGLERASLEREIVRQWLYALVGVLLVAPFALGPAVRSRTHRVMAWAPLAWVGLVSYGVYLWHQGFLTFAEKAFDWPLFEGHFWGRTAIALIGSLIAAAISFYALEQPVSRWVAKRTAARWSSSGARS
jgi:peptidoglycan/LPS O-acetylase OafA/YrhL